MDFSLSKSVFKLIDQSSLSWAVAKEAHSGQTYGDKPYTYHLGQVRSAVIKINYPDNRGVAPYGEEDTYYKLEMVANLHDSEEDTYLTSQDLLDIGFPEDVVEAVTLVTKKEGVSYKDYLKLLSQNELAWKVKVADTYCNLTESMKDGDVKRVRKYSEQLGLLYKFKNWEE